MHIKFYDNVFPGIGRSKLKEIYEHVKIMQQRTFTDDDLKALEAMFENTDELSDDDNT